MWMRALGSKLNGAIVAREAARHVATAALAQAAATPGFTSGFLGPGYDAPSLSVPAEKEDDEAADSEERPEGDRILARPDALVAKHEERDESASKHGKTDR